MNPPTAAPGPGSHHEFLLRTQARLMEEYAELLKTPNTSRNMDALHPVTSALAQRARRRPARRSPRVVRREPPVFRFTDPPPCRRRPLVRPRQTGLVRVFVLLLILHVLIIGVIVFADMIESSMMWKAVGCAFIIWLLFRGMAALSRRIKPSRRTTSRTGGRNCDRDIWL